MRADRREHLQVTLAMLRLNLARLRGDVSAVVEEARRLLAPAGTLAAAQMGLGEELRAIALLGLATTELWTASFDEAERHLEQARALAYRIGRPYLEFSSLVFRAIVEVLQSSALAVKFGTQAIELAGQHGWTDDPLAGSAYLMLGTALVGQGRLEEAEPWIRRAERAVGEEAQPAAGLTLHYVRAEFELARGRDEDALAAFRAGERLAERLVARHPLATRLRALLLRTLVRTGATERVERALAELDEKERETGEMRAALAALRLAQDDPRAATLALGPVIDGSALVTNRTSRIEAFLLEATARDALGDPAAAGRAVERALDIAEPDGTVLPFLLHPVPRLLERHPRHRTAHASLISEILNLLAGASRPLSPAREPRSPRDRGTGPRPRPAGAFPAPTGQLKRRDPSRRTSLSWHHTNCVIHTVAGFMVSPTKPEQSLSSLLSADRLRPGIVALLAGVGRTPGALAVR